jgi:hypothetical protein
MGGGAPAAASAPSEMAALVANFRRCEAAAVRSNAAPGWDDAGIDRVAGAYDGAVEAVGNAEARTLADLRAKARVLVAVLRNHVAGFQGGEVFDDRAELHEWLAMSFADDVLALA